uniref:LIM zinc-binding domain-containing protein n=1 Tax=Panagrolaimus sp. ES5 TaxID=591445 RepID=A0AC34FRI9_9BILA
MMTAEIDSDTRKYLRELDSFGLPPEPFKIISEAELMSPQNVRTTYTPEFRQKLHKITVDHQKRISDESSSQSSSSHHSFTTPTPQSLSPKVLKTEMLKAGEKAAIKREENEKLRLSVLKANRPLNPWIDAQKQPLPPSEVGTTTNYSGIRSVQSPLNVQTLETPSRTSLSPISPISNSATSTSSNGSINASSSTKWNKLQSDGTYSAKICSTESTPTTLDQPKTIIRTYRPNSVASVSSMPSSTVKNGVSTSKPTLHHYHLPPLSKGKVFVDHHPKQQPKIILLSASIPTASATSSTPNPISKMHETITKDFKFFDDETSTPKYSDDLNEAFSRTSITPARVIGKCGKCFEPVFDNNQVTYALDSLFHDQCFSCSVCHQALRGKKFFHINGKNFCEDDYFLNGNIENSTRCAECGKVITDMVLQALGKSYHPRCFRCTKCYQCLDGVPFAVDNESKVFCMEDYQKMFSPNCAVCMKPIKAANDFGQIVRVVAMEKEYHIDCYRCEGCGIQLTNEPDKQCFPLNNHLLCRRCNSEWSRLSGIHPPMTDC